MLSQVIVMALTFRPSRLEALPSREPRPLTLWVAREAKPADNQNAATQAIGLHLDAEFTTTRSTSTEATLTLKRRTVEFLLDPSTGQTSWLHSFGLQDEIESVERSRPDLHVTLAKTAGEEGDPRTCVVSPAGHMARLDVGTGTQPKPTSRKAEAERDNLVGMLLASGWTWRDADDTLDH